MLDNIDQDIIILLIDNPFRSMNDIAKVLEIPYSNIKTRISKLKENGYIRKDNKIIDPVLGERIVTESIGIYDYNSLGLIRQHVIFYNIPNYETLINLERFCDIHPYTKFRVQLLSSSFAFYAQFDFPLIIISEMEELYQHLCELYEIPTFTKITASELITIKPNLFYWSKLNDYWDIINKSSPNQNPTMMKYFWNKYLTEKKENKLDFSDISTHEKDLVKLNELYTKLIRELTINGNVGITELASIYNRDKSTISRHITFIKENYVKSGKLFFNPSEFKINSFRIISGELDSNILDKNNFLNFFSTQEFPFYGYIVCNNDKFLFYLEANQNQIQELYHFLWKNTKPASLKIHELLLQSTYTYHFYNGNYKEDGTFNIDRQYFFDDPLTSIKNN